MRNILCVTEGLVSELLNRTNNKQEAKINYLKKIQNCLQTVEKNKNVIYTCITGGYDDLVEPVVVTPGFDYVCFTDDVEKNTRENSVWKILPLPEEVKGLDKSMKNRYMKMHPNKYFPEYDFSLYVDGSIKIKKDLTDFIKDNISKDKGVIFIPKHFRKCIYEEGKMCVKFGKAKQEDVDIQMNAYKAEGYPKNYGLTENNIIFRYHNDEKCIKLMEFWWDQLLKYTKRDQLSLFYSSWKTGIPIVQLKYRLNKSEYFEWNVFHNLLKVK